MSITRPAKPTRLQQEARIGLLTVRLEMVVALTLPAIFTSERLRNKRISQTLIFMTSLIPSSSIFFIFLGSLQYAGPLNFTPGRS